MATKTDLRDVIFLAAIELLEDTAQRVSISRPYVSLSRYMFDDVAESAEFNRPPHELAGGMSRDARVSPIVVEEVDEIGVVGENMNGISGDQVVESAH